MGRTVRLVATTRIRNGHIWAAVKKYGSQRALAEVLGLSPSQLGLMLNFKVAPSYKKTVWQRLELICPEVFGVLIDDVFPQCLHDPEFQELEKTIESYRDVPEDELRGLLPYREVREIEYTHDRKDLKRLVDDVLHTCTPREEQVCRMLMDGMTHREAAKELGVSGSRVDQIHKKALRKIRYPGLNRERLELMRDYIK